MGRKKAQSNAKKHGVSFTETRSVFFDDKHSESEDRFILLGLSDRSRILIVCHCERSHGQLIRLISARKATARERQYYEGPMP